MYLRRKIDEYLLTWKNKKNHLPCLIKGIRQCGKTMSILNFAKNNYKNYIYVNFWDDNRFSTYFDGSLDVDTIINYLSLHFSRIEIKPHDTLIIFDEIQECPRARLSFKNFAIDKRYDVIGSGSFLGINGYVTKDATPIPSGYETTFVMKTMDFEEFLWAFNYKDKDIKNLKNNLLTAKPVPLPIHEQYKELFKRYICVGGFPNAINTLLETNNILEASRVVANIVEDIKNDFGRRVNKNGEPVFNKNEISKINQAFELIPTFLAKDNKRFIVSKISGGSTESKLNAIDYLEQVGLVYKVYNLDIPSLPLLGNKRLSQFKLFVTDIGLLVSLYKEDTLLSIYKNELGQNKGALYEAIVLDSLYKANIDTFYFAKESGLEIDFVIANKGMATLLEVKYKNGNTKSAKTILNNPNHYGKTKLIKIGDYNIGKNNGMLTIPHYLTFLINKD